MRVFKFSDNIDTDLIIAARYLNTSDEKILAKYVMEDARAGFFNEIKENDCIVAGENFGCGSSREHAPIALKAANIKCVIAKSFARIFYRNAFNTGLLILECADCDKIDENDEIEIDLNKGEINNISKKERYNFNPIPEFMQELLKAGGLIEYASKEIK